MEGPCEGKSEEEEAGKDELSDDDGLSKDGSSNRVFWKEWLSNDELVEDDQLRDLGTLEKVELDSGDGFLGDLGTLEDGGLDKDLGLLENGELITGAKPCDTGAGSKNGRFE